MKNLGSTSSSGKDDPYFSEIKSLWKMINEKCSKELMKFAYDELSIVLDCKTESQTHWRMEILEYFYRLLYLYVLQKVKFLKAYKIVLLKKYLILKTSG